MDYAEINVDHKFHRHLIGKNGANSKWGAFLILAVLRLFMFSRLYQGLCSSSSVLCPSRFLCSFEAVLAQAGKWAVRPVIVLMCESVLGG